MRSYTGLTVLLFALALGACKDKPAQTPVADEVEPVKPVQEAEPADAPKPVSHTSSVPGMETQLLVDQKIPQVTLAVTAPKEDEILPSGDFEIAFEVKGYRTGHEIGQHVHAIIDNDPYIAHYDVTKPLKIEGLAEGTHTLRAFPARHYHLALKEGDVFQLVTFHVKKKSDDWTFDPTKPFLTYSRPKGSYAAEHAKELLLDFFIQNAELGKDSKVIYGVDGEETELLEWKPVLIGPLAVGEHTITLKLVDMKGQLIENGGFNNTTRKITITE